MSRSELIERLKDEAEENTPDVLKKVMSVAEEQGLFYGLGREYHGYNCNGNGTAVAVKGGNKAMVGISSAIAALACVTVAGFAIWNIFRPAAPSFPMSDTFAVGAVSAAKLLSGSVSESAEASLFSENVFAADGSSDNAADANIEVFDRYFSAFELFGGEITVAGADGGQSGYDYKATVKTENYFGTAGSYEMFYTDAVKDGGSGEHTVTGEIIFGGASYVLQGERPAGNGADEWLTVRVFADSADSGTYMQVDGGAGEDGAEYRYTLVIDGEKAESSTLKTGGEEAYSLDIGGANGGSYRVMRAGNAVSVEYTLGSGSGTFAVQAKDGGYDYVFGSPEDPSEPEQPEEPTDPNAPTDGLEYTLNPDGNSYSLTGIGSATAEKIVVAAEYDGKPVTAIGVRAFKEYPLKSIKIPEGVTAIGDYAFNECAYLAEIDLPESLKTIGTGAFWWCPNLEEIALPCGIREINDDAFLMCYQLTKINYGGEKSEWNAVIKDADFYEDAPNAVVYCTDGVFDPNEPEEPTDPNAPTDGLIYTLNADGKSYSLTGLGTAWGTENIIIASEYEGLPVTGIEGEVFYNNGSVKTVKIPDSFTSIGDHAFTRAWGLESIDIPDSVKKIGAYAFYDCHLKEIKIGKGLESVYGSAFVYCDEVDSITVSTENPYFYVAGKCLIERDRNKLVAGWNGSVIPDDGSVTWIGSEAFKGRESLKAVTIPESVTLIDDLAFSECTNLTGVVIPDNVKRIWTGAFNKCTSLKSVALGKSTDEVFPGAFVNCTALETVTVPAGNETYKVTGNCLIEIKTKKLVTVWGGEVVIPDDGSVTRIGSRAFFYSEISGELKIPDAVTDIDHEAFCYCPNLNGIIVGKGVSYFDHLMVEKCPNFTYAIFDKANGKYVSYGSCIVEKATGILVAGFGFDVRLPADGSIKAIAVGAFRGSDITEIVIPASVKKIDSQAFMDCKKLTSITFADPTGWKYDFNGPTGEEAFWVSDPQTAASYLTGGYTGCVLYK